MRTIIFGVLLLFIAPLTVYGQSCCISPDNETTVAIVPGNAGTEAKTTEFFQQTLSDISGDSFYGQTVTENNGATGSDACYNDDPNTVFSPFTSVSGSSWVVGSQYPGAYNGTNQWGGDNVRFYKSATAYYRNYMAAHEISSCGTTLNQNMTITCASGNIGYAINILTSTIYFDHVQDCRQEGPNNQSPVCANVYK